MGEAELLGLGRAWVGEVAFDFKLLAAFWVGLDACRGLFWFAIQIKRSSFEI